ncbi:AfsR/SARP family transcriptional regulator [Phytomonospora endophytica]|uniref:DNA-binding SARP family transcriptional activator n=1 Tax=Phytomonospora endophytica TaxID=714109 RepID=A0A841FV93_9ACTN|nr:BTAD domain-containing putative transcriptional regulator [Phytomonospora endophytica]MBB6039926.1 DNA-binding SARP family transcriptional activator [Phytomonospora endophytica]GIG71004.1 SARP family transcriptional regulator [Phytomonospora endophytica]
MEFFVLGPLEVRLGERVVPVPDGALTRLLATLLLEAGRICPVPRLVDALWDGAPPTTAERQVRNAVPRLRERLGDTERTLIETVAGGYRLRPEAARIDCRDFQDAVARARDLRATGRPDAAETALAEALALWRGEVLGGPAGQVLRSLAAPLEEARTAAYEDHAELRLELDRPLDPVVDELSRLLGDHPLRQRLTELLMRCLHRQGRRAEAIDAYERLRERLAEEFGIDPSERLRALLRDESAPPPAARPASSGARPAQLPAAPAGFCGRAAELRELDATLAPVAVVSAVSGTAGVGKTALAVHWAHTAAERFPDGQLYVDLRGFGPEPGTVDAVDALGAFLAALGMPLDKQPSAVDARAALYRSMLAGRRMFVLLDNARDADQVRPLLPAAPGCLTLVTSRRRLPELADAHRLDLDLFTTGEAHEFLRRRLGDDRVAAEPEAAEALVESCARLPLALAIAAARAALQPEYPLSVLAAELERTRGDLTAFGDDDPATDVRAVFSWSYRAVSPPAARLFRLLSLHPGPEIGTAVAASIAAIPPEEAKRRLDELVGVHLLTERAPGRHVFHDLLRVYAAERNHAEDPAEERTAATRRVADHYLHTGARARELLVPGAPRLPLPDAGPEIAAESPATMDEALEWFDRERTNLRAAFGRCRSDGFDLHTRRLAWIQSEYQGLRGHLDELISMQHTALESARRDADPEAEIYAHRALTIANARRDDYDAAEEHIAAALSLCGDKDPVTTGTLHRNYTVILDRLGRPSEALRHCRASLEAFERTDVTRGRALALAGIGWFSVLEGDLETGIDHAVRALTLFEEIGADDLTGGALDTLGLAHHRLGEPDTAISYYERALAGCRRRGDRGNTAGVLDHLGDVHADAGRADAARRSWAEALAIFEELREARAADVREKLRTTAH